MVLLYINSYAPLAKQFKAEEIEELLQQHLTEKKADV